MTEEGTQTRNKETSSVAWTEHNKQSVVLGNCDLRRDSDGGRGDLTSVVGLTNEQSWRMFLNCDMKDLNLETRRPLFYGLDSVE